MIGHSHHKAGELTLGSDSLYKLCHIPKKSPNFPPEAVKKPNPQLLHLLTYKLKAMAVVIPEKDSPLLNLALGLFSLF